MTDYKAKLNDRQLEAVCAPLGAVLVLAGAGSGKTRVLTSRIIYLVKELHVDPGTILAITFTNKAANEMKSRLFDADCQAEYMRISTIHSFCAFVLRNDAHYLDLKTNFSIYSDDDKQKVIKKVIKNLVSEEDDRDVEYWSNLILEAKEGKLSDIELERKIVSAYNDRMRENNALDFDDLLFEVHKLFTFFPEVLQKYQNQFLHICIDEFQDTNKVQYEIFRMLSQERKNIFVVGDDDQSIYSWRGADVENMFNFEKDFPNAHVYTLEQNYRSTQKILSVANEIIAKNTERHAKTLFTENGSGVRVEMYAGYNEQDEAYYVISQIINLRYGAMDYNYSDCAVLMRINALTRSFEQECKRNRIPYKVVGGFKFFERKEIKDVVAYLRMVDNRYDNEAFERAVGFPKRGIGETTLKKLQALSEEYCVPIVMLIGDERNLESFSPAVRNRLLDFYKLYEKLTELSKTVTISVLVHNLLAEIDIRDVFMENDEEERVFNIDEFEQSVMDYQKSNPTATLSDYLENVTLVADKDENVEDCLTISTIHGVKGLEFKAVFVVGLEDGLFPVNRATYNEQDMQEERRLMYVAVTRAKERLYLCRANTRFLYGARKNTLQSVFFTEVQRYLSPKPQAVLDEEVLFSDSRYDKLMRSRENETKTVKKNTNVYKVGQRVEHTAFGEGIILKIEEDICDVVFEKNGKKRINVSVFPLKIVK